MRASAHLGAVVLALAATACATVVPAAPRAGAARTVPTEVAAAYRDERPVPTAARCLHARRPDVETWDVLLPPRTRPDAPADESAPIVLRWWRPVRAEGRRPAVVLSPILGNDGTLVADFAQDFARRGWHALLVLRPDLDVDPARPLVQVEERTKAAVVRQVQALDWLLEQPDVDPSRVASFGISAGGIQTAMVAGVDPRYRAHVIALAGGPLADVLVDSSEGKIRALVARGLAAEQTDREGLRARLRGVLRTDPVALARHVDPDAVLLVLATRDRSVPTELGLRLREALGDPETVFVPTGHYGAFFALPRIRSLVLEFLRRRLEPSPPGGA